MKRDFKEEEEELAAEPSAANRPAKMKNEKKTMEIEGQKQTLLIIRK